MSKRKQTFEQWLNKESELKVSFFKQLTQDKIAFYGLQTIPSNSPLAQGIGSDYQIISGVLHGSIYIINREFFDKLCRDFNSYKHQQKNQGSIRFQAQISKQAFKKFEKIKNDLQIKTTANTLEFLINSLPESCYPKAIDQIQQLLEENKKLRKQIHKLNSATSSKDQVRVAKEYPQITESSKPDLSPKLSSFAKMNPSTIAQTSQTNQRIQELTPVDTSEVPSNENPHTSKNERNSSKNSKSRYHIPPIDDLYKPKDIHFNIAKLSYFSDDE